jgi:hypothetical protein
LSKVLNFADEEDRSENHRLLAGVRSSFHPNNFYERFLVDKITFLSWKQREIQKLLQGQLALCSNPALPPAIAGFIDKSKLPALPVPGVDRGNHNGGPVVSPWECQGMVLRVSNNEQERKESHVNSAALKEKREKLERDAENTGVHLEVKLGSILDTLLRYNTTLERDLDRTISLLTKLQRPEE